MSAPTDLSRLPAGNGARLLGSVVSRGPAPGDAGSSIWTSFRRPATSGPSSGHRVSSRRILRSCATSSTSRGLKVCGGTVFAGLHNGKEALD